MRVYVIVLNELEWNSGVVACDVHRWCRSEITQHFNVKNTDAERDVRSDA